MQSGQNADHSAFFVGYLFEGAYGYQVNTPVLLEKRSVWTRWTKDKVDTNHAMGYDFAFEHGVGVGQADVQLRQEHLQFWVAVRWRYGKLVDVVLFVESERKAQDVLVVVDRRPVVIHVVLGNSLPASLLGSFRIFFCCKKRRVARWQFIPKIQKGIIFVLLRILFWFLTGGECCNQGERNVSESGTYHLGLLDDLTNGVIFTLNNTRLLLMFTMLNITFWKFRSISFPGCPFVVNNEWTWENIFWIKLLFISQKSFVPSWWSKCKHRRYYPYPTVLKKEQT